jgi:hypothetical protein
MSSGSDWALPTKTNKGAYKMSKNKLTDYEQLKNQFTHKIVQLRDEKDVVQADLHRLHKDREAALLDFLSDNDVSNYDTGIMAAEVRMTELQERIRYAEQGRRAQLAAMIPDVSTYMQKQADKKKAEYEEAIKILNTFKLSYLKHMTTIGAIASEVDRIHATENQLRNDAGVDEVNYRPFTDRMKLDANPAYNGFTSAAEESLCIPDWLCKAALEGRMPQLEVSANV